MLKFVPAVHLKDRTKKTSPCNVASQYSPVCVLVCFGGRFGVRKMC